MDTERIAPPKWLLIAVWITAGLCLALAIAMVALTLTRQPAPVAELPPEKPQAVDSQEETVPPEPTRPILDLTENPYGPEDFGFRGRYLECSAGPCQIGVDVSEWQEEINWPLVQAAGMEFAMIRLAWRGNTEGVVKEDKTARANLEGAAKAGLPIGGYVFSQAITVEEAVEEAEFALEVVKDYDLTLPIVFDWERSRNRTANVDIKTLTDCAKAFCETIEEADYEAMVYFNPNQAYGEIDLEELKEYGFWLAMYESDMDFPYRVDMWQYSQYGSVPGVLTAVDLNIRFLYE